MSRMLWLTGSMLVASLATALGCKEKAPPPPPAPTVAAAPESPPPPPNPARQADEIFRQRCTVCHGPTGQADGPGAAALNPKPQVFTDAAWQTKVTDEELTKAIVGGGVAVGRTPGMPANPDLQTKPEVVAELVKIVRKFKP
jgi:mono/diheme cytochrome c family protein